MAYNSPYRYAGTTGFGGGGFGGNYYYGQGQRRNPYQRYQGQQTQGQGYYQPQTSPPQQNRVPTGGGGVGFGMPTSFMPGSSSGYGGSYGQGGSSTPTYQSYLGGGGNYPSYQEWMAQEGKFSPNTRLSSGTGLAATSYGSSYDDYRHAMAKKEQAMNQPSFQEAFSVLPMMQQVFQMMGLGNEEIQSRIAKLMAGPLANMFGTTRNWLWGTGGGQG